MLDAKHISRQALSRSHVKTALSSPEHALLPHAYGTYNHHNFILKRSNWFRHTSRNCCIYTLFSPALSTLEHALMKGFLTNFPSATINSMTKEHLNQTRQNHHSTKTKSLDETTSDDEEINPIPLSAGGKPISVLPHFLDPLA